MFNYLNYVLAICAGIPGGGIGGYYTSAIATGIYGHGLFTDQVQFAN
jgi:hypothetical protein